MNKTFPRRFPMYLSGLLLGLAVFVVTRQAKQYFAPEFVETPVQWAQQTLKQGGKLILRYEQNPEHHLAYGFPSALFAGKQEADGHWAPWAQMNYADLVQPEVTLWPKDVGTHEIRAAFYSCKQAGDAKCKKISLVIPLKVSADPSAASEVVVGIDLLRE